MGLHSALLIRAVVATLAAISVSAQDTESCVAGSCEEGEEASALQVKSAKPEKQGIALPDSTDEETLAAARDLRKSEGWLSCGNSAEQAKKEGGYTNCTITGSGDCALSGLQGTTRIHPGGSTTCLDSNDYWFEVIPGDLKKLYLHFQGGGACWNKLSYYFEGGQCTKVSTTVGTQGLFDPKEKNPYASWTKIVVQYCSGDMHGGDVEMPWGENGMMVPQRGYANARAVVDYALENFPTLDYLTVGGCSAGSLGLQLWANRVFSDFKDRKAKQVAIGDSFLGVLYPPPYIQPSQVWLYKAWNMCTTGVLDAEEERKCKEGTLRLIEVWDHAMKKYPDTAFVQINSKVDATQIKFEQFFELTALLNYAGYKMTGEQYYQAANALMAPLAKNDNYHIYLVDGPQHCFTPNEYIYLASPSAYNETTNIRPSLIRWLDRVQETTTGKRAPDNTCYGEVIKVRRWPAPAPTSTDYCDAALNPSYKDVEP